MKVNKEDLLRRLESVQYGLTPKETIQQSDCFVFSGGRVVTFSEEVCCRIKTPLDVEGAVKAAPLLDLLRSLPDGDIDVSRQEGRLTIKAKGHEKTSVVMEADVLLPLEVVEKPGPWKALHQDFGEALDSVSHCAVKQDDSFFTRTCVHIHPEWLEAYNAWQVARFTVTTGLSEAAVVRMESVKAVSKLGMTKFSMTANWLHLRNPSGLVYSVHRQLVDYPQIDKHLVNEGVRVALPKTLTESAKRANLFSVQNADQHRQDRLEVLLTRGRITVKGQGVYGEHKAVKKVNYDGPELHFLMAPKVFMDLVQRQNEVVFSQTKVKAEQGRWQYVAALGPLKPKHEANGEK